MGFTVLSILSSYYRAYFPKYGNFNIKLAFHCLTFLHHMVVSGYSGLMDFSVVEHDEQTFALQKYAFRLLTGWNFAFQTMYLFFAILCDIEESKRVQDEKKYEKLQNIRNILFTSLVVPFTLFVSGMFWSIYAIDRELVFPSILDLVIPFWINQALHTTVVLVVILELYLQPIARPSGKMENMNYFLTCFFAYGYAVVFYGTYFESGKFLYKIFSLMNIYQIILYQLAIWTSIHLFYELQWLVIRLIHFKRKNDYDRNCNSIKKE